MKANLVKTDLLLPKTKNLNWLGTSRHFKIQSLRNPHGTVSGV